MSRLTDEEIGRIRAAHEPMTDYQIGERWMVVRNGYPTHPIDALHMVLEIWRLKEALAAAPRADSERE